MRCNFAKIILITFIILFLFGSPREPLFVFIINILSMNSCFCVLSTKADFVKKKKKMYIISPSCEKSLLKKTYKNLGHLFFFFFLLEVQTQKNAYQTNNPITRFHNRKAIYIKRYGHFCPFPNILIVGTIARQFTKLKIILGF